MKIALIAMSGIRVQDAELRRLGLTLPGFVERSRVIASLPSLGLLTLAGMTPAGHDLSYIEVRDLPPADEELPSFDLVAISTFTAQAFEAYELADRFRHAGSLVVLGGLHVTSMVEEALDHCNAVVRGEGEVSWAEVLADAEHHRLHPVYSAAGREFDLAEAPMPRYELLDIEQYNRLTVQTSRGCPWRCEFCASSILLTSRYKQKPVDKVLAEIDQICSLWRRPFIEFADDNSFVDRRYWKHLLPELAARRIRWFAETDISVAEDEELLRLMRASGCREVLIGLESPLAASLHGVEMKVDWKLRKLPAYRESIERIQSFGIRVNACFVLGMDGQDHRIFDAVSDFVEETQPYDVQITIETPFAGSHFYDRLQQEGRLLAERPWDRCTLFDVTYRPAGMSPEALRAGFRDLGIRLYSEDATRRRRESFRRISRLATRSMGPSLAAED